MRTTPDTAPALDLDGLTRWRAAASRLALDLDHAASVALGAADLRRLSAAARVDALDHAASVADSTAARWQARKGARLADALDLDALPRPWQADAPPALVAVGAAASGALADLDAWHGAARDAWRQADAAALPDSTPLADAARRHAGALDLDAWRRLSATYWRLLTGAAADCRAAALDLDALADQAVGQ